MDKYVSFAVAELLFNKGFNYMEGNTKAYNKDEPERLIPADRGNTVIGYYIAPYMQDVVDLLRTKYNTYISVGLYSYGMNGDKPAYYPIIKSLSSRDMGHTLLQGFTMKEDYYEALDDGLKAILVEIPRVEPDLPKDRYQQVDIERQQHPLYNEFADKAERFGNECKITANGKVLIAPDPRRLFERYKEEMK